MVDATHLSAFAPMNFMEAPAGFEPAPSVSSRCVTPLIPALV